MPIMPRFPRYGNVPFQYYNTYRRNNFYNIYRPIAPMPNLASQASNFDSASTKINVSNSEKENFSNNNIISNKIQKKDSQKSSHHSKSDSEVLFELFGIKLYFDDVLILSLLFFLYKENVKDEGLFLALVLLLIS